MAAGASITRSLGKGREGGRGVTNMIYFVSYQAFIVLYI